MIEVIAVALLAIASPEDRLVERLLKCREIADDRARLECFDEAFVLADEGADGDEPEAESSTGTRTVHAVEETDGEEPEAEPPAGSRTVLAGADPAAGATPAVAVVPDREGERELSVRCDDGELSVSIDWGQYLGTDAPEVVVKIDSLPPSRSKWARSEDKHASVLRPLAGKKARQQKIAAFVNELVAGKRLAAQVRPRGQSAVTAVFDLSPANGALRAVRRSCW